MTLIVGIRCSDGVVMAADSAATFGDGVTSTIGQQSCAKLHPLGSIGIYASTGSVGASQVVMNAVEQACSSGALSSGQAKTPIDGMTVIGREIASAIIPLIKNAAETIPIAGQQRAASTVFCKSLLAIVVRRETCLFEFDHAGTPEMTVKDLPFKTMGSGQPIADPFLAFLRRVLWTGREPTTADGRFAAAWTVIHTAQTNPGGVALPLQLATLTIDKRNLPLVTFHPEGEIEEHQQAVAQAELALRGRGGGVEGTKDAPEPPRAPE